MQSESSQQFDILRSEFEQAWRESEVSTEEQLAWAKRFLKFAQDHIAEQAGIDALMFITRQNRRCVTFKEANDIAVDLMIERYLDREETAVLVFEIRNSVTPKTNQTLEALTESRHATIRGVACFSYACGLLRRKQIEAATSFFERVIDEFPDLSLHRFGKQVQLRPLAEQYLVEIRELQIGMMAPETEGVDLAGEPLKLSDFRGKTVMLYFWGDW